MAVVTKENQSILQEKTNQLSGLNPCQCDRCIFIEADQIKQRPNYPHWFCDTCGRGPFDSTAGQRPVYRRNVSDGNGNIKGIRFACTSACANQEQIAKLDMAKINAQKRGDMETMKELRMEIDELKKQMAEKPKEVFWPSTKS